MVTVALPAARPCGIGEERLCVEGGEPGRDHQMMEEQCKTRTKGRKTESQMMLSLRCTCRQRLGNDLIVSDVFGKLKSDAIGPAARQSGFRAGRAGLPGTNQDLFLVYTSTSPGSWLLESKRHDPVQLSAFLCTNHMNVSNSTDERYHLKIRPQIPGTKPLELIPH